MTLATETEERSDVAQVGPVEYPHPKPNPRLPVPEQRELVCKLTQAEVLARGDEMAHAELKIVDLKEERRGLNGEIAKQRELRRKLALAIDTGEEKRMIACEWSEDYEHSVFRCKRTDTGEEIATRTMSAADHQADFGFDEETGEVHEIAVDAVDESGDETSGPGDEDDDGDSDDEDDDEDDATPAPEQPPPEARAAGRPRAQPLRRPPPPRKAAKRAVAAAKGKGKGKAKKKHTRHAHA